MNSEEKHEKLQLEKKRRLNSERREQRLKATLEENMYTFDDDDHDDFQQLFSNVDGQKLSPDLNFCGKLKRRFLKTKTLGVTDGTQSKFITILTSP